MKTATAILSLSLVSVCLPLSGQTTDTPSGSLLAAMQPVVPSATESAGVQTVSVSQVRIVRLSQVKGEVELDRQTGQAFDLAFVNLPIVAGVKLRTGQGLAEVEFEDNSSLRLTPQSQVEFPRLGRNAAGSTITSVNLLHGSLYVSLADGRATGDFSVIAGNRTILVSPSAHLRVDLDASTARMTVFQGRATVTGPSDSMVVGRRQTIAFDTASASAPQLIHNADPAAFDSWDKNAVDYHRVGTGAVAAAGLVGLSGAGSAPYSYGLNDLSSYGSFSNIGGCGSMWRPYLASASFDPYGSGTWSWYPGQGYSWVSPYPWGWTPFHSGSWNYCAAGGGWGWSPQGNWNGLLNQPTLPVRSPGRGPGMPVRPTPPPPPIRGGATLIPVNIKALQISQQDKDGKFVFRNDSAGLGVPRGVFNNLAKFSQHVEAHGSASTFLSDRQVQVGLLAPPRFSNGATPSSASFANYGSATRSTGSSASNTYSGGHAVWSNSPSSGAINTTVATGPSTSSAGSPSTHH